MFLFYKMFWKLCSWVESATGYPAGGRGRVGPSMGLQPECTSLPGDTSSHAHLWFLSHSEGREGIMDVGGAGPYRGLRTVILPLPLCLCRCVIYPDSSILPFTLRRFARNWPPVQGHEGAPWVLSKRLLLRPGRWAH